MGRFSDEDMSKFAQDAIEKFKTDHDEINEIYDYIVLNRQQIIFNNGSFAVVPDQSKFVEKNVLFYAMKQLGFLNRSVDDNEESDQKKQFGNKMQELTRLGIIVCEKRGQRIYYALNDVYLSDFLAKATIYLVDFQTVSISSHKQVYWGNWYIYFKSPRP